MLKMSADSQIPEGEKEINSAVIYGQMLNVVLFNRFLE